MRKVLIGFGVVAVIAIGVYGFRAPLMAAAIDRATAHMFVARDDDAFDPGIGIGQPLPAIKARFAGREVQELAEFAGEKGLAVFVNRSVDW